LKRAGVWAGVWELEAVSGGKVWVASTVIVHDTGLGRLPPALSVRCGRWAKGWWGSERFPNVTWERRGGWIEGIYGRRG
jgi:hypothetical protein